MVLGQIHETIVNGGGGVPAAARFDGGVDPDLRSLAGLYRESMGMSHKGAARGGGRYLGFLFISPDTSQETECRKRKYR